LALNVRNRRETSTASRPPASSQRASEEVLAVSAGPKQPKQPRSTAGQSAPQPALVTGAALALLADAVPREVRATPGEVGGHHLEKLVAIDRAPVQLEVDFDVVRHGRGRLERRDVVGMGVDSRHVLAGGGEIAQTLDPAGGGAGTDGDQPA
jgi:hypothetical protein